MKGFITDNEMNEADQAFPGIANFFHALSEKPRTFLDLVAMFERWVPARSEVHTLQSDAR